MAKKKIPLSKEQKRTASSKPARDATGQPGEDTSKAAGLNSKIPVVGLGGSAGALDSIKRFLAAMPADSGAAFVVIQHLAPAYSSMLTELLSQQTRMPVFEAHEGTPVEPNSVYVIPPNRFLGIRDGALYLAESVTERGIRMPIDFFARSLAEDRQERAILVLLSGAGSDGTLGVRAIRGAGGLTIAQDQTAQFGDMPRNAVLTGLVDLVLAPDQMPKAIMDYLARSYVRSSEPEILLSAENTPAVLDDLLNIVQVETGCDFRCYKKSTIMRRIERRMGLQSISDMAQYSDLLRRNPSETIQLSKDLLINVTAFFRDADEFEELRQKAIVPLIEAKQTDAVLRVWAPGCASGEEAYSIAMLLMEEIAATRKRCGVQVFATDIDQEALQFGRTGMYPESIITDVGPDRLSRFFIRRDQAYQVSEPLRSAVVFAAQNLITDPPFSRMDLISCRNLLIYIDAETQARLIPLFNYSLNPGGYLFMGKSESVGSQHEFFDVVSKKARLYRRITPAHPVTFDSPIREGSWKLVMPAGAVTRRLPAVPYTDLIRQALLNQFSASVVLIDRKGQVLQFHGQTGKYLDMPTGEPNLNLLEIAKEGLSPRLRAAIFEATSSGRPSVIENVRITSDESSPYARITVMPTLRSGEAESLAVIFEDVPRPVIVKSESAREGGSETLVRQLEDELRATQQDLQSTIEQLQSSNEELRLANEEVVSTNEELQSTNEELETSKEELQSVNEELTTVNSQLHEKIEGLNKANSDMANLLTSTQIAALFLDRELRIKMFTPAVTRVLKLIPSDTDRPISDLSISFIEYDLPAAAQAVARDGSTIERELRHINGSSYLVNLMPYRTQNHQVDGVIITLSDVTNLRRAEKQTRQLAAAMRDSNDAVILFDKRGNIKAWNQGAQLLYGWSEAEAVRMNVRDMVPAEKAEEYIDLIRRLLAAEKIASFETQRLTKDGRVLDVWLTATSVLDESGNVEALAATERDITERKRSVDEIRRLNETLENRVVERTAEAERRAEQLRQLASELTKAEQREQRRLAQVLHDGLQQILVGAKYQLARVEHGNDDPHMLGQVQELIDEAIETSRSLTSELSPPILHQGGLIEGLTWLTRWMQQKHGLVVDMKVLDPIGTLPENISFLLFQAVRELLFNAVKHARVKTANVEVTRPDEHIHVVVEDKGTGFDPVAMTAGDSLKGIGLFSLRERINMLGGRMEIDSSPGRGSRFELMIPYTIPPEDLQGDQPEIAAVRTSRPAGKRGAKKIRVLLADDHTIVRQGLAGLLGAEEDMLVVGEASDGVSAVNLIREIRPDVVLMDINMPGMNGIEATRIIHRELPDVRVIGLSMFERGEQATAMREAGAADYVAKSGPSDAVISAIRACLHS